MEATKFEVTVTAFRIENSFLKIKVLNIHFHYYTLFETVLESTLGECSF